MSGECDECDECGEHAIDCECLECTEFSVTSSMYGLKYGQFDHLEKKDKMKLVRLIARISERAYRRGVQQALYMKKLGRISEDVSNHLYEYRYEYNLDGSPGIDGFYTSSLYRLSCEENLQNIGLSVDVSPIFGKMPTELVQKEEKR